MDNGNNRKIIAIIAVALVAGVFLGVAASVPQAQANAVTDFFGKLFSPLFVQPQPSSTFTARPSSTTVPLYQPVIDYEQAVVSAVKKAAPAVVSILISKNVPIVEQCPYNPFSNVPPEFQQFFGNDAQGFTQPCDTGKTKLQEVGGGSGFIISSDGLILTNKHVVSDTGASYTVITNDGKKYDATVLARDPNQDLAVVKINATGLSMVALGDSDSLALGQTAITIGNALGEFSNTVSVGVISGLARTVTASGPISGGQETIQGVIQTDAAINPGNSGGPLLNLRGEVVGINTAVASDAQNIGFALPINRAKHDIASVRSTGEIQTPYLGVRYLTITPDIAKQQNLPVSSGVLVRGNDQGPAISPNSPAAAAGLQTEDIIISVNGQALDSNHDLATIISGYNIGDTVTLVVNRGGKQITLKAILAKRPAGQ
ncbi:MAG: trypsin-like peptidase domain-containing protein [Minisyncoccia bacterium]|jgi:S1-C subfamily serine protease